MKDTRVVANHYEADMYMRFNGGYRFERQLLPAAHEWCQKATMESLGRGNDTAVSNTFCQRWEMKPYLEGAAKGGHEVVILHAKGGWNNVHDVPLDTIERMKARWEE